MNQWNLTIVAFGAALALAGCGGDGPGNPNAGGGSSQDAVADGDLDTTTSASNCLNPALFASGARYQVTFREFEGSQTPTSETLSFQITGNALFNGSVWQSLVASSTSSAGTSTVESFIRREDDRLVEGGAFLSTPVPGQGATRDERTRVFEPPIEQRFDLEAGESFLQTYRERVVPGDTVVGAPLEEFDVEERQTFAGVQAITVPAGRFRACRFDYEIREQTVGSDATTTFATQVWFGEENGLILRTRETIGNQQSGSDLVSARINGVPVEPTE